LTRLLKDIVYWDSALVSWAADTLSGREFPILNSSIFSRDSHKVMCLMTDASGLTTDGFGGVWAWLFDSDFVAFSISWALFCMLAAHSHGQELQALLWWLKNTSVRDILLIWISDSSSACWSINKGYCANEESFLILEEIFTIADAYGIAIVALWEPREHNTCCDVLSHLTALLHRDEIVCPLRDLNLGGYQPPITSASIPSTDDFSAIPGVRTGFRSGELESDTQSSATLPLSACSEEFGLGQVTDKFSLASENLLGRSPPPLARRDGAAIASPLDRRTPIFRHYSERSEGPVDTASSISDIFPFEDDSNGCDLRSSHLDWSRWSTTCGRDLASLPSARRDMGSPPSLFHSLAESHEDASQGQRRSSDIHGPPWPLCSEGSSETFRSTRVVDRSVRPPFSVIEHTL